MTPNVLTGLENLAADPPSRLKGKKLGLLANPASVDHQFNHASRLINHLFPGQLTALFSPQHGFYAEKQDNMVESDHFLDPFLNIPIFSLYSNTRKPTKEMMDLIDVLIVDLQDAGTRVYTFIYTISYCLEAATRYKKAVIILDRPNPIGGKVVEGNLLSKDYSSFVGRYEMPMRHALTVGEFALMINKEHDLNCDLTVIPMIGWHREMYYPDTGLNWVMPSPNLPTPDSAMVYPGQVILEGTNLSEGRGTTRPFELFGAPFIDPKTVLTAVKDKLDGVTLRPVSFEPTSGKFQQQLCRGFQIHITARDRFKPYKTSLLLLQQIIKNHGNSFQWKEPPYEYEFHKKPIDLILGSRQLRKQIAGLEMLDDIEASWKEELFKFQQMSRRFYLYDD